MADWTVTIERAGYGTTLIHHAFFGVEGAVAAALLVLQRMGRGAARPGRGGLKEGMTRFVVDRIDEILFVIQRISVNDSVSIRCAQKTRGTLHLDRGELDAGVGGQDHRGWFRDAESARVAAIWVQ